MKFVAIKDFRNNCGLEIKDALGPNHVHKGAVFSIGDGQTFEQLTTVQQKLISDLKREGCICDADDAERVKMVRGEIAADKEREKRDKQRIKKEENRLTFDRRIGIWAIVVGLLAIALTLYLTFYK